jgi:hypothetical protein
MNVLEGLDGFGQVSQEAKANMAAAARGMAKSYGEAMRRKYAASPSPMDPGMPAPAAGPSIGTVVLVGGAVVGVAGLAYFLLR